MRLWTMLIDVTTDDEADASVISQIEDDIQAMIRRQNYGHAVRVEGFNYRSFGSIEEDADA